jgi:hypothetical protein
MRARERAERRIKPLQIIVTEEQHRRLRIRAAMDSTNVSELVRARIADIIDPKAVAEGVGGRAPARR